MGKNFRLKDVAQKAGVGVGTASRVLNNHPNVSPQKRQQVLQVIEEMGYRPNIIARSLKTNSTKTIGVIIMDITNPFYSDLMKGLQDCAASNGYSMILADLNWRVEKLPKTIKTIHDRKVDGLIYLGSSVDDNTIKLFLEEKVPVVFISTTVLLKDKNIRHKFANVGIDNEKASYDAVSHLIELGHKEIALISGIKGDVNSSVPRMKGYQRALEESRIEINEEWILYGHNNFKSGYEAMLKLLKMKKKPTAVFGICDLIAMGATKAAVTHGYNVPKDIAIIGFDGIDNGEYFNPSISTIIQPRYEMGYKGMKTMLKMLKGEANIDYEIILEHKLEKRESTGAK